MWGGGDQKKNVFENIYFFLNLVLPGTQEGLNNLVTCLRGCAEVVRGRQVLRMLMEANTDTDRISLDGTCLNEKKHQ